MQRKLKYHVVTSRSENHRICIHYKDARASQEIPTRVKGLEFATMNGHHAFNSTFQICHPICH